MTINKIQLKELEERLADNSPGTTYLLAQDSAGSVRAQKIKLSGLYSEALNGVFTNPTFTGVLTLKTALNNEFISTNSNGDIAFNHGGGTSLFEGAVDFDGAVTGSGTFGLTGVVTLPTTTSIGTVSSTEIGYLDGVTSAIQTQFGTINGRLNVIDDIYPLGSIPEGHVLTGTDDGLCAFSAPINNLLYSTAIPATLDARQGYALDQAKAPKLNPTFTGTVTLGTSVVTDTAAFSITRAGNSILTSTNAATFFSHNQSNRILYTTNGAVSDVEILSDGLVSVTGTNVYIGSGNGIAIDGSIIPEDDSTYNLGSATKKFNNVYAANGVIQTSDARLKTEISNLTENELEASIQLGKEIGTYRFLASVAEKGDNARMHVGMTVQRAIEIMEQNGLNPFAYSFICHDVEESIDIYSFRYTELLAFICAGFEARLSAIENK